MNRYQKRTKLPADNDALGSFLLLISTITTRPGSTPWAGRREMVAHPPHHASKEDDATEEMIAVSNLSRNRPKSQLPYHHEETRYR
jgi:hypothetical protein